MRRGALRGAALGVACLAAGLPGRCLGHGTVPAALEVLALDSDAPAAIRLNIGVAARRPAEAAPTATPYFFVCPAHWAEEDEIPRMARMADGRMLVPRFGGVWRSDAGLCGFERSEVAGWAGETPVSVAGQAPVRVVTRNADGSAVFAFDVDAAGALLAARTPYPGVKLDSQAALPAGGGYVLAAARPSPALVRVGPDGPRTLDLQGLGGEADRPQFVDLRLTEPLGEAGARLYLTVNLKAGVELATVDLSAESGPSVAATRVALAAERVLGPVAVAGALAYVADLHLHVRSAPEAAFVDVGQTTYTCLHMREGRAFACRAYPGGATEAVVEVTGFEATSGRPIEREVFRWPQLGAPTAECQGEGDAGPLCRDQWVHRAAELALYGVGDGGLPPPTGDAQIGAPVDAGADAGIVGLAPGAGSNDCAVSPGRPGGAPAAALLCGAAAWVAAARRRRARPVPGGLSKADPMP